MKIICIGRNYAEHAKELNNDIPTEPVIFLKPETAIAHSNNIIYPEFTNNLQYECEIVLKIAKSGKNILESEALQYIDEWTVGIDFTARDLQQQLKDKGLPWEIAKAFDQSAVVGKFIPIDKQGINQTQFSLELNNQEVQKGHVTDLIFSFEKLIAFVSTFFTLEENDLLFTGTPKGVGPVKSEDKLNGYLNGENLFNISII